VTESGPHANGSVIIAIEVRTDGATTLSRMNIIYLDTQDMRLYLVECSLLSAVY